MNPRTTGILFLVALALGIFVYVYEFRLASEREAAEAAEKRLFGNLAEEDVEEIAFETSDGQAARLRRVADGWRLVEPVDFPADGFTADGMASMLAELASEREFEDPQPREVYGLGEGATVVRFQAAAEAHELRFGDTTPVGANTYAATAESENVYTIPTYRVNTFRRTLDDLRDKRVVRFDPDSIVRIHASWPGGSVRLEREPGAGAADGGGDERAGALEGDGAGTWRLVEPFEYRADETSIELLFDGLERLRALDFLDDPPDDAELGLSPPDFEVVLETRAGAEEGHEGPTRFHVAIGALRPEGDRVARGAEGLYVISAESTASIPRRSVSAYQWKQLAEFEQSDAQRFEIEFLGPDAGDAPYRVVGEYGDTGWSTQPDTLQPGKPFGIVSELRNLRAAEVAAESLGEAELASLGLSPPRIRYRVYGDAPEEGGEAPLLADVLLGEHDAGRGTPAMAAGRDTVYRLEASSAELLPVSYAAYRDRFVDQSATPDAEEGAPAEADASEAARSGADAASEPGGGS